MRVDAYPSGPVCFLPTPAYAQNLEIVGGLEVPVNRPYYSY